MADEKLPEYVEEALARCGVGDATVTSASQVESLVAAIHRYAREREAAALERAAQVCDAMVKDPDETYDEKAAAECLRSRIRALIHKEPANG